VAPVGPGSPCGPSAPTNESINSCNEPALPSDSHCS